MDTKEKFWNKVDKTDYCWNWMGTLNNVGYGQIYYCGKLQYAHRLSYEFKYGIFDLKMHVLHKCDNPKCINPEHLFLGTRQDNTRDMLNKGRHRNQSKTHCIRGHELSENNIIKNKANQRKCKTCFAMIRKVHDKKRYEKLKIKKLLNTV